MDGIAGALAAEVGDEQIDIRGLLLALIDAHKEVARPEYLKDVLVDGNVSTAPAAQLRGKLIQGKTRREDLAAGAGLQKDGRAGDDQGCQDETRGGVPHDPAPPFSGNEMRTSAARA